MYFIKCALDFCKVKVKLLGLTFKGKQNIFPNQQQLSLPTETLPLLHYKATMKHIAIHSQQEPLICMLTQQGFVGCCTSCLAILVVPVDLNILSVRSSECKHVMSSIGVG